MQKKHTQSFPVLLLATAGLLIATANVHAAFPCTTDNPAVTAYSDDVTFGIAPNSPSSSDDCFVNTHHPDSSVATERAMTWDAFGGDPIADPNNASLPHPDDPNPWSFLVKDEGGGAVSDEYMGLKFTVSSDVGSEGSWTLSWTDLNGSAPGGLEATLDFAVLIKSGASDSKTGTGGTAGYLFEGETLPVDSDSGSGTFRVVFTNNKGDFKNISHLTILARQSGNTPPDNDPPNGVSEPSGVFLIGIGALGLLGVRRRRDQAGNPS